LGPGPRRCYGDVVEVEIDRVGLLRNGVADEA